MCISDNVTDHNFEESLASTMVCFDLDFNLNLPDMISKLEAILISMAMTIKTQFRSEMGRSRGSSNMQQKNYVHKGRTCRN